MCTQPAVSLDGATSAGPGETVDLGRNYAKHTAIVTATSSPTNVEVGLEFSHDGTNWARFNSANGSSFPFAVHTERVARYVRANLLTLSGGSSPTVTATIAST